MAPPKPTTQAERTAACRTLLAMFCSGAMPMADPHVLDAISIVKGLFNRVVRQDQWDWFTVNGQLGFPSVRLAKEIADRLAAMRTAIRDRVAPAFEDAIEVLHRLPTRACIRVFVGELAIKDELGCGWVYILSTRELPDLLKVGMTTRTVEQRAREINSATGVAIPFGVRRCWRVRNPEQAETVVHDALKQYRVRHDREFFRVPFHSVLPLAIDALAATGLEIRTLHSLAALEVG